MNAQDGFRKSRAEEHNLTVRDLVAKHGDAWRIYAGNEHRPHSDSVTFDAMEKISMWLMEEGASPRISPMDLLTDGRDPVQVEHVYPPIPERCWDYAAYRDPEGKVGRGGTPFLAINDLIEQESEQ